MNARPLALSLACLAAAAAQGCGGDDADPAGKAGDGRGAGSEQREDAGRRERTAAGNGEQAELPAGTGDPAARRLVRGVYAAVRARNAKALCARLSAGAREKVAEASPGKSCAAHFRPVLAEAPKVDASVAAPDVEGETATVAVSFPSGPGVVTLVAEDGAWKIDSLSLPAKPPKGGGEDR